MENKSAQTEPDGYYDEDMNTSKEDFDLSFLDEKDEE